MTTSQNGWPVYVSSVALAPLSWITGRVAPGAVHVVLDAFCRRFDAEVERIDPAASWGWAYRPIRGQSSGFSNHASGTAIDLNAPQHPLGKRGTFTPKQITAIHRILEDFDGVLRWGGDYTGRPDEMHIEINATPAKVAKLAARLSAKPRRPKAVRAAIKAVRAARDDAKPGSTRRKRTRRALRWLRKIKKR